MAAATGTKTLTVAEAAEQWLAAKKDIKAAETKLKPAKAVLLEHFRRTGRSTYKGLIAYSVTPYVAVVPDLVRQVLGKRISEVEETRERETLSPLQP